ncbi:MAG TPA: CoA transferase, partial [Dehalococcoidia bacterium]|nr:CoA transferase [Dehalococcoidia bacterium]
MVIDREREPERLKGLLQAADVVVEDLGPGVLEGMGLGYEELKRVNPGLVLVRISPFGQDGPYAHRPGDDLIAEAMGGRTLHTSYRKGTPMRLGLPFACYLGGAMAALSSLIALYYRDAQKTGLGQWMDLALYEVIFRTRNHGDVQEYGLFGVEHRHERSETSGGIYLTKDGAWISIGIVEDTPFFFVARAMGRDDLLYDPRFEVRAKRIENAEALDEAVRPWVAEHTRQEVAAALKAVEGRSQDALDRAGEIIHLLSIEDIFKDPQHQYRRSIIEVNDPVLGPVKMPGVFPRLSLTPGEVERPAPLLGEHNEEVFARWGPRPRVAASAPSPSPTRALEGLTILDAGVLAAGPYGPTLLGDFGALVIKIEQPYIGDRKRDFLR